MRFQEVVDADSPKICLELSDPVNSTLIADHAGRLGAYLTGSVALGLPGPILNRTAAKVTGGFVSLGKNLSNQYAGASAVTVEMLARVDVMADSSNYAQYIGLLTANTTNTLAALAAGVNPDGSIILGGRSKNSDGYQTLTSAAGLVGVGDWHLLHFVLDFANATLAIYVDANGTSGPATFGSTTYQPSAATFNDALGAYTYSGVYSAGVSFAHFALYDQALSAEKIAKRQATWALRRNVPVVTTIDGTVAQRNVRALRASDGYAWPQITSASDGTGTITIDDDSVVQVMAFDDYGDAWKGGQVYSANAKAIPTVPNGHWYQSTGGGTSGAAEPSWPTDGSAVTDGTVSWTDMGTMRAPVIQGPFIPVAS